MTAAPPSSLFSLPGEWVAADGSPRPPLRPGRIGVILPGGPEAALAAEPALTRLRRLFPEARIAVLAAAGTAAMARLLGLADTTPTWPDAALDPFDLLIDLRVTPGDPADLPDAHVIAGIGEGPHLAVAVPYPGTSPLPSTRCGLPALAGEALGSTPAGLELSLEAEAPHSPVSAGRGDDDRALGFGLLGVSLTDLGAPETDALAWEAEAVGGLLGPGWYPIEPWGTWSGAALGVLRLPLPPAAVGPFEVRLRLRGFVHAAAPEGMGVLRATGAAPVPVRATLAQSEFEALITLPPPMPVLGLSAGPLRLPEGGGRLRLRLRAAGPIAGRMLRLSLRPPVGRQSLASLDWPLDIAAAGVLELDMALPEAPEAMLELALDGPPASALVIEGVELRGQPATDGGAPAVPAVLGAWSLLVEGCAALSLAASPPPLHLAAPREARPGYEAARAAGDAGAVVVALLPYAGWPAEAWAELATGLKAVPGVWLMRPAPEQAAGALAALLSQADLVVGDGGLALALAARSGLRCLAVLAPGSAAPSGPNLSWVRAAPGAVVAPGEVLALLAPEIALRRQQRS
ncbi:hypothetical protein C8P66_101383 [Humitalea rosea]|uniref:Uncharacterized protein n=1 Tax=Humitalea rosea TaxID=990373 RepID=A0A2W7ITN6_9PROT|nr:hypothetical protein [Humitalea rosea]PZW51161.1 hypothetical protein C8P66_101383 [Humitalea rosea]